MQKVFKDKDYKQGEALLYEAIDLYSGLSENDQQKYQWVQAGNYYNLACIYSLTKNKKKAMENFEKAVKHGYTNYSHIKSDTDLDYIRKEKRFVQLMDEIRVLGDYPYILQQAGGYQEEDASDYPAFEYEDIRNKRIRDVKTYFKLDSVAGQGDEISKIINILNWVHNAVKHDGSHWPTCEIDAIDIYNYSKANNGRGVNCRALAIMLNECYLSMGFKSRFITCLPKDVNDPDCHVINSVYSTTLRKWIWMDPSFNAYLKDENDNLLSIAEVRDRIIKEQPVILNEDANRNGNPQNKEWYIDYYMAKNLYWFQCPARSFFNIETNYRNTNEKYISLLPLGYERKHWGNNLVTHDPGYFWQRPDVPVEASAMLTPEEMKKDIDFFFNIIGKVHANIYAFVTKETMDERKKQLYELCSKPMKAIDFNMHMCRLNDMFDGNTSVTFIYNQELNSYDGFFPLPVHITGGKIYLLDENGTNKGRILSINQVQSSDIYNKIININEIKATSELRRSPQFSRLLFIQTDIRPPYSVVTENGTTVLEGVSMKDVKKMPSGFDRQSHLTFRIYPEKSIAIIDYNSCSFGRDEAMKNQMNTWFDRRFKEIADKKIKTLFIDISRNGGGNSANNDYIFERIKHDDTIRLTYVVQKQYDPYAEDGKKELGYMRSDTFTNITLPNRTGFDGDIYLIQGYGSYSAAIGVAEWMKESGNAKSIGEQTGQATAVYIDMTGFKLPKSQIYFGCAFKYWKALPDGREDQGVLPDVPVKLDYSKSKYELNDLLSFLHQIDPTLSDGPEKFPQGTKVMVKNATASAYQPNEDINKALDGNFSTMYHTPWTEGAKYPVTLTFDFEKQPQIDYFIYYPRTDMLNGLFGIVEIWAGTKSSPKLKKIATHDFQESNAPSYFQFPQSLKDPLKIELRVMSSATQDYNQHVSCAEIEFYKKE
ncbi:MAG: hypothetical protein LBQ60_16425 [Bacteroidales bacterium]|nr:hypothetical protein [Bacteroidales bacterium]